MKYKLIFKTKATRQIKKLDRLTQRTILTWLKHNIDETDNPRRTGKGLSGNFAGYWRYRIGDYRVICEIHGDLCEVVAVNVGHRRAIYVHKKK